MTTAKKAKACKPGKNNALSFAEKSSKMGWALEERRKNVKFSKASLNSCLKFTMKGDIRVKVGF